MTSASPVFVKSQMPRMHVQNLLTGQWYHRDVQGITSPLITWNLNAADTFTCTLAPPRADMLDSTGNPVLQEWRDAVYLEENNEIKYGGILTSSSFRGPQWQIGCTGFGGYPNGIAYEGPNITAYNIDALDAVRVMWNWMQAQPGGDLGMKLGTQKAGVNLGANVTAGVSGYIAAGHPARKGDESIWLTDASSFSAGMGITVNGRPYKIRTVVTNAAGTATGQVVLINMLREAHATGELVLQVPSSATLTRDAPSGQNKIWTDNSAGFSAGETILISGRPYVIAVVFTTKYAVATGEIQLNTNLGESHPRGAPVVQAPQPWTLYWYNSTDIGQEIQSVQAEAVFDWREAHTWTDAAKTGVSHQLQFGVHRLGSRRSDLRFTEGENIVQPVTVTRDGTAYADTVIGLGAGSGGAQVRSVASARTGRLRRSYVYTDQTAYTTARMSSQAQRILASMSNIDAATQVVVKNHPNAPFGSFAPGDDIPVRLCTGWRNTLIWSRITAIAQDPVTGLMTLTVARSDSFSYLAQSGQAGTI